MRNERNHDTERVRLRYGTDREDVNGGGLGEAALPVYTQVGRARAPRAPVHFPHDEGAAAGEVPREVLGVEDISKASVPPARRSSSFR